MKIKCFRCNKKINTPDSSNADYVIAADMMVRETRVVFIALKHNQATLAKLPENATIEDSEYDRVEIPNVTATEDIGEDLAKVVAEFREMDIQKTGVVCPKCYKDTDFVIWGVHRK